MRATGLILFVILMAPLCSEALMAPAVYHSARRQAPLWVSIRLTRVAVPKGSTGPCTVTGTVIHVLRNQKRYRVTPGSSVVFTVACVKGAPVLPAGPVLWQQADALSKATFAEVFLEQKSAAFHVVSWQFRITAWPVGPSDPVVTALKRRTASCQALVRVAIRSARAIAGKRAQCQLTAVVTRSIIDNTGRGINAGRPLTFRVPCRPASSLPTGLPVVYTLRELQKLPAAWLYISGLTKNDSWAAVHLKLTAPQVGARRLMTSCPW